MDQNMDSQSDSNSEKSTFMSTLTNPHLKDLNYVQSETAIYANLYKLSLNKNYDLYQYAVIFADDKNMTLPNALKYKIILKITNKIVETYGNFISIGSSFYSTKKIDVMKQVLVKYNEVDYTLNIQPTNDFIEMRKDTAYMIKRYFEGKSEIKTIFEVMVREILKHNQNLKYVLNLFGNKSKEIELRANCDYNDITVIPGYMTKVMILESGIYLNVDSKTKITSAMNVLELIKTYNSDLKNFKKNEIEETKKFLLDKTVEAIHSNTRFKIVDVNFEKRARNFDMKSKEGGMMNMVKYFKDFFSIDIDPLSPVIALKRRPRSKEEFLPSELLVIVGMNEEMRNDKKLVADITKFTKMSPSEKLSNLNDIISMFNEKKPIIKVKKTDGVRKEFKLKSCYEIKQEYGLEITDTKNSAKFTGKIMKLPQIQGENGKNLNNISRTFKLYDSRDIKTIVLYKREMEGQAKSLKKTMQDCSAGYGIKLRTCDFKGIESDIKKWKQIIDKVRSLKRYNIITLFIDDYLDNKGFYDMLKEFTQEKEGVPTQVIKQNSLRKNAMSVVSNILIQMNTKIGGCSYIVDMPKSIKDSHLMVIGVDSSGHDEKGKMFQSISFCASINDNFTDYYVDKTMVEIENYENTNLPISTFVRSALVEYFMHNKFLPKGVIIYRQGVSAGQKNYIQQEVEQIQDELSGNTGDLSNLPLKDNPIPYYYVIVNKKSSLKFFEKSSNTNYKNKNTDRDFYDNPDAGLLICDQVTNPNSFEFYIQPQKVNQGTATPTCYQVEYGNMNEPEMLPKLTFDLCFLYSNWRGAVRVPAPLKYAEKLAKVKNGIHEDLKNSLSFI